MNEPKEQIRYHVSEPWAGRSTATPVLETEHWQKGAKKARLLLLGRGYSIHSHLELENRAKTPEEALEQYRAQKTKARDRCATELLRLEEQLALAIRARIEDGKLVLG
jgi:hypothetical protein